MKILFVRPRPNTVFSFFNPIKTEPLELEYLSAVSKQLGHESTICDESILGKSLFREISLSSPDVVAITGYITAENRILDYARRIKKKHRQTLVIVGGVHAEINHSKFKIPEIDIIVTSGGSSTFAELLTRKFMKLNEVKGIIFHSSGLWVNTKPAPPQTGFYCDPDRHHFYCNKKRYQYLFYGPVALVKTSFGCPYPCNFCFCRLLNNEQYSQRPIEEVVTEIQNIDHGLIWLIDDDFLLSKTRVLSFVELLKKKGIRKKYIMYGRADFIAQNADVIRAIKGIGVIDIIVGLEASDDSELDQYNKKTTANDNIETLRILKENKIQCTSLFIIPIDANRQYFKNLISWIRKHSVDLFTVSIFTPMPGTALFKQFEDKLITRDPAKWDMLHLVLKPTKMSTTLYLAFFMYLHILSIILNKQLRKNIFKFLPKNHL